MQLPGYPKSHYIWSDSVAVLIFHLHQPIFLNQHLSSQVLLAGSPHDLNFRQLNGNWTNSIERNSSFCRNSLPLMVEFLGQKVNPVGHGKKKVLCPDPLVFVSNTGGGGAMQIVNAYNRSISCLCPPKIWCIYPYISLYLSLGLPNHMMVCRTSS